MNHDNLKMAPGLFRSHDDNSRMCRKLHRMSGIQPFDIVLFDFDFTLADSSIGIIQSVNFALRKLSLPQVSDQEIRSTIGLPLEDVFERLVAQKYIGWTDEFLRLYVERADLVMTRVTRVFEAVPETIESLTEMGIALGIVSTKERHRIEAVLERDGLLGSFDIIIGGDDGPRPKPDPEGLLTAIKALGASPSTSLYVGDSTIDAETSRRAKVPFAAVLSGATHREDFDQFEVCGTLDSITELPYLIMP